MASKSDVLKDARILLEELISAEIRQEELNRKSASEDPCDQAEADPSDLFVQGNERDEFREQFLAKIDQYKEM